MIILILLTIAFGLPAHVQGFGRGAPASTCFTQYPKHGLGTQKSVSPYQITLTPASYTPGQDVTITVTDTTGEQIRGIQMAARRATGNTEEIVGSFKDYPQDKLQVNNCFGGLQNIITHKNNEKVNNFTFKWTPPSNNVGAVSFRSTIVRSFSMFWYDVLTELPVANTVTAAVESSTYTELALGQQTQSVDFSSCGDTKGCFFYPRHCSGSDCIAAASFMYNAQTKRYHFELSSSHEVDYISLGFSHDVWMGGDWTVSCTGRKGKMSVQEGHNPGKYNDRHLDLFTLDREVMYKDGKLQCRFSLPEKFQIYQVAQGSPGNSSAIPWDLSQEFYLFLAWGDAMADSSVMAHHHDLPAVSFSKVDLKSNERVFSSSFHTMVRAHGALLMTAWILFTGIVTVVSRHFKDWMPATTVLGTKLWFQVHRGMAIVVLTLTALGILLIFVHYGPEIREDYAVPHAYVGLAVVAAVGLQMIGGMFRPGADHKLRPIFNWAHFLLGHSTHILAAATMFLAYDIKYVTPDMKSFGTIALAVTVVIQVLWHIAFEAYSYRMKHGKTWSVSMEMNGADAKPSDEEEEQKQSQPSTIMFIIYVLCLVGVWLAALLSFLLF